MKSKRDKAGGADWGQLRVAGRLEDRKSAGRRRAEAALWRAAQAGGAVALQNLAEARTRIMPRMGPMVGGRFFVAQICQSPLGVVPFTSRPPSFSDR